MCVYTYTNTYICKHVYISIFEQIYAYCVYLEVKPTAFRLLKSLWSFKTSMNTFY